jgi:hypothetical protein
MAESREVGLEELATVPEECSVGNVFAFTDNRRLSVICKRDPMLPSQKGHGHCPKPESCFFAGFPGDTIFEYTGKKIEEPQTTLENTP